MSATKQSPGQTGKIVRRLAGTLAVLAIVAVCFQGMVAGYFVSTSNTGQLNEKLGNRAWDQVDKKTWWAMFRGCPGTATVRLTVRTVDANGKQREYYSCDGWGYSEAVYLPKP